MGLWPHLVLDGFDLYEKANEFLFYRRKSRKGRETMHERMNARTPNKDDTLQRRPRELSALVTSGRSAICWL